ncbi:hypothetical protein PMAYCL1PPCAC_11263 [Pristionchus mayeri]|uniref:Uncharacterized protein n=1 Tax=Pristionchus mayeri TaxID=1317129 RepID=A0AAN4ZM94_9BILA|nr:hypothetical protein PMAYCL1PPCAC_11263 [Pristionchus mayeri]
MSAKLIRFVGNYDVNAEGKFMFEILAQLKDFGVGRMLTKSEWSKKWPDQPSYLIIKAVEPEMDRWLSRGKLWADWTYRGKNLGTYMFEHDLNRSDWRLVHKHEEAKFSKCDSPMKRVPFPDTFPLPPLQVHMSRTAAERRGSKSAVPTRAPLQLCIDPELQMVRHMFKQVAPAKQSASIYDEVDKKALLDLYGKELPTKVEAWSVGPAELSKARFPAIDERLAHMKTF